MDWVKHDESCNGLLSELTTVQNLMLHLKRAEATNAFEKLFEKMTVLFKKAVNSNPASEKNTPVYLRIKQLELMLRNLKQLKKQILKINSATEIDIIKIFEKQFRFKKVLLRHIAELEKS